MKITEDDIERYLNNACDGKERLAISNYFIRHPEVLNKYLTERSWEQFNAQQSLPHEVSKSILTSIRNNTYANRRTIVIRNRWFAAAAVLLLISGTALYLQLIKTSPVQQTAQLKNVPAVPSQRYLRTFNANAKTLSITLGDGSTVKLQPNSELSYPVPFTAGKRALTLKGEALFDVAKDKASPFTVYAGNLATTALGTVFSISAFEGKAVRVHLLSGKVRVESDSIKGLASAILLPGQQLKLDATQHFVITRKKSQENKSGQTVLNNRKLSPSDQSAVTFHNEPLANIFTTLSERYHTHIKFNPELVAGMTFTGKYDPEKESLHDFIQMISSLNNLSVVNENGTIQVMTQ